ncbi:hypothetical protein SDC9_167327 [bioreactor metagenome]|uniref:FAD/NAD(P)-binding domain-containing protein n=1 Tax=bioreactor metagenome TaxID=1076179 RepID=A0A645G1Y6_9ZZZZ
MPVYTRHTIVEAVAGENGCVSRVIIAQVDQSLQPVSGTEQTVEADCVAIAAGLKPVAELLRLLNCRFTFSSVFGGWVPLHNDCMETSLRGVYVAGDTTGVEEANTALEEGRVAGISAAAALGLIPADVADARRAEIWGRLKSLRLGPFGERRLAGVEQILAEYTAQVGQPAQELLPEALTEAI